MNQQERNEKRDAAEKAIRFQSLDAARQATSVIQVLDYAEYLLEEWNFAYCPKCGEKL
jgi:RNA polymerase-binding transcription factor DksA